MVKKPTTAGMQETEDIKFKIDTSKLKRKTEKQVEEEVTAGPMPVSSAAIDKALDLAFAPSRDMLPSVTIIDKFQGRLFPLIDMINIIWDDVMHIAFYRQDKEEYKRLFKKVKPASENWLGELLYRTALWQKSIGGANLTKITDIALAEMETRSGDEGEGIGGIDAWGKE